MALASSPLKRSASRSRSWFDVEVGGVDDTSAISFMASRRPAFVDYRLQDASWPRGGAAGSLRTRRTSTSSEASRNRTDTRSPEARNCWTAVCSSPKLAGMAAHDQGQALGLEAAVSRPVGHLS